MNIYIRLLCRMRIGSILWRMEEILRKRKTLATLIHMRRLSIGKIDCMKYQCCDVTNLLKHSRVYPLSYGI